MGAVCPQRHQEVGLAISRGIKLKKEDLGSNVWSSLAGRGSSREAQGETGYQLEWEPNWGSKDLVHSIIVIGPAGRRKGKLRH